MPTIVTIGARLVCGTCGAEVIVTRVGESPEIVCHGRVVVASAPGAHSP